MSINLQKNPGEGTPQQTNIFVLSSGYNSFGQMEYLVFAKNSIWKIQNTKGYLDANREYQIKGTFSLYTVSDQSIQNYNLSLGITGEVQKVEIISKNLGCFLVCQVLQTTNQIYNFSKNTFKSDFTSRLKQFNNTYSFSSQDIYGLSLGLVLGGSQEFTPEAKQDFKNLGLTHLVAVSGFQVVILMETVQKLLQNLRLNRQTRVIAGLLAIFLMVVIVGPQPPVLRSGLSILLSSSVLLILGRRIETWRTLIYSALIMLVFNPFYLLSVSFQLSFLASLGLVFSFNSEQFKFVVAKITTKPLVVVKEVVLSPLQKFTASFSNELVELFFTTLSAFLFTLPVIINLSGKLSLLAIPTNILIIPTVPFITLINLLGLIPYLGQIPIYLADISEGLILKLISYLSSLHYSVLLTPFSPNEMFGYYLFIISTILLIKIQLTILNKSA